MSLQKIALSAVSLAAIAFIGLTSAQAATATPALTKAQVEQIVHDYIMNNPKVLMDSVAGYQQKMQADREAQAGEELKKNMSTIVKDVNSPEAGNAKGDVTVVEFFDYNCHFCKGAFPAVQGLIDKDKKVRVVFKEFPILGPSSQTAAQWALAANKQGKYFAFHAAMMNNKEQINDDLLQKVAKSVGMDIDKAKVDINSPEVATEIAKNRTLAEQLDINGTPAFIVGDQINRGAIPEDALEQEISEIRATKK